MMRYRFLVGATLALVAANVSAADANRIYDNNCALCHQKAGVGLSGQFPRLAGRLSEIAASDEGRRFLTEVTLYGMAGKIEVDGATIIGVMPPFAVLSDNDIASVLNYLISLQPAKGKRAQITPADVATLRAGPQLSPSQVHANRRTLSSIKQ
jgi:mono/diheme cytochrome c family protein